MMTNSDNVPAIAPLSVAELAMAIYVSFLVPMGDPSSDLCHWGMPLCLVGEPGIAKTAAVDIAGAALGAPVTTEFGSILEAPDVGGALVVDDNFEIWRKPALESLKQIVQDKWGIFFLDEFGDAPPAVQAAFQGVIHKRQAGSLAIPPKVRLILAANPPSVGGFSFRPQAANRLCHIPVAPPSPDEWEQWAVQQKPIILPSLDEGEERIISGWKEQRPAAAALVAKFLSNARQYMHKLPPSGNPQRHGAWPSARTWEFTFRVLATIRCFGNVPQNIEDALIYGLVGEAAASAFQKFQRELDLPSVEEILSGKWRPDAQLKLDQAFVAYSTLHEWFKNSTAAEQQKNAERYWRVVKNSHDVGMLDMTQLLAALGMRQIRLSTMSRQLQDDVGPAILELGANGLAAHVSA